MPALDATDVLRLWEQGENRSNWQRGLLLLAPCFPGERFSELPKISVGTRNRALLRLMEQQFGARMDSFVSCPFCGEALEFSVLTTELLAQESEQRGATHVLEVFGFRIEFRMLDSVDLSRAAQLLDVESAAEELMRRSVVRAVQGEQAVSSDRLPPEVVEALADALAGLDPLADPRIPLTCAASEEHVWRASLDPVVFLWSRVERQARRLLEDVQTLAAAYGWHEADILGMSEGRRRYYLEAMEA